MLTKVALAKMIGWGITIAIGICRYITKFEAFHVYPMHKLHASEGIFQMLNERMFKEFPWAVAKIILTTASMSMVVGSYACIAISSFRFKYEYGFKYYSV